MENEYRAAFDWLLDIRAATDDALTNQREALGVEFTSLEPAAWGRRASIAFALWVVTEEQAKRAVRRSA